MLHLIMSLFFPGTSANQNPSLSVFDPFHPKVKICFNAKYEGVKDCFDVPSPPYIAAYRVIQNNPASLQGRILELIFKRFFLYENFIQSLIFELKKEIVSELWDRR